MTLRWKSIGIWTLKILVFIVAWGYVIYKFQTMDGDVSLIFKDDNFSIPIFIVVCLLMFANWGLEAFKWQKLVECTQKIPYKTAVSGVLIGLPLALITPNRIGEIGGRAIVLEQKRKDAVFATFLGSLMQLLTTLLMGMLGIIFYLIFLPHNEVLERAVIVSVVVLVCLMGIVIVCKQQRWVKTLTLKLVGKKWYVRFFHLVQMYTKKDVVRTLLISILRYCVFSTQFALLIYMLLPELSFVEIFVGITLMYLFTTLIPTSVLGEIGIRGSVAMAVFQLYTTNVSIIFQISILIWIINIVAPTLTGSVLLLKARKNRE